MNKVYINNSSKWEMNTVLYMVQCSEGLLYLPRKKRRVAIGWPFVKDGYEEAILWRAHCYFLCIVYSTKFQP